MENEKSYKDMLKEEPEECCDEDCDEAVCCDKEACCEEGPREDFSESYYWRNVKKAERDKRRDNMATLHVFKGQTKEQAEAALKEARKTHPKGCTCGNCNFRAKYFASKSDKPEIYASKDQTIEQVKELIKKSSKSKRVF